MPFAVSASVGPPAPPCFLSLERLLPGGAGRRHRPDRWCGMIEMTIYGRGGQGGVTLAKLIATSYFLRGQFAQAFGVYAAERSGAPLQAYVRVDEYEIVNHNQVRSPDHVIVLDRTLISPAIFSGLKPGGWVILNTPEVPESLGPEFAGRHVASIDATGIAIKHKLGTRSVPIVNTTMLGAVLRILGEPWESVADSLGDLRFGGENVDAAREAFDTICGIALPGTPIETPLAPQKPPPIDLLDEHVGEQSTIRTGTWANRQPHRHQLLSPCSQACPAGNDIQSFVRSLRSGDYDEALSTLLQTTPLPAVCGRVCPAPCIESCNRALFDEPVQIRDLERAAADKGTRPSPSTPWRSHRIAVIGTGPAGLSAAYHLAKLGYPVDAFEGAAEAGGLLRYGIPSYRLPPEVLDAEIDYIVQHGVNLHVEAQVDRSKLMDFSRQYDAVFLATGLQQIRSLNLGPADSRRVIEGIDFLDRVKHDEVALRGERVIVIGGGNTAIDAARSALRAGASAVEVVYRRSRREMPAIREEIDDALDEGVILRELVTPLRLREVGDSLLLSCRRMTLGPPDESGRRQPIPEVAEGNEFDLPYDRIILALGQSSDLSILPEGSEISDHARLLGLSGSPIFIGGDFATNDGTVAAAIGNGRRAALHIHRTLSDEALGEAESAAVAGPEAMHMHVFSRVPAYRSRQLSAATRRHTFSEVRLGYEDSKPEAMLEAARCMSCGVCNGCDRCVEYCPEGILRKDGDGYLFDYDYCKGCGVCATQCPRGVIYMAEL